jgi:hypothetical protein
VPEIGYVEKPSPHIPIENQKITYHLESALFDKMGKKKSIMLRDIPTRMYQAGWYMSGLGLKRYWA